MKKILLILVGLAVVSSCKDSGKKRVLSPLEKGRKIALQTKSTLGSNLKRAISTNGTAGALSFCSTSAIPLTAGMATAHKAKIKRVSDKNRNPMNKANRSELQYINEVKSALAKKQKIKPKLIKTPTGHMGYYPIVSNKMCLQCHGSPNKDIAPDVYSAIKKLYPADKAIGYKSNQLRGIWVIEMQEE